MGQQERGNLDDRGAKQKVKPLIGQLPFDHKLGIADAEPDWVRDFYNAIDHKLFRTSSLTTVTRPKGSIETFSGHLSFRADRLSRIIRVDSFSFGPFCSERLPAAFIGMSEILPSVSKLVTK